MYLKASAQEIESFICIAMGHVGTIVERQIRDETICLQFTLKYLEGGEERYFNWGRATISQWDDQTDFSTNLNFPEIYAHCNQDRLEIERWKELLQGDFNTLNNALRNEFGKARQVAQTGEPAKKPLDPAVAARRERVGELSRKKLKIESIATEVSANRSTVIRDRNELGITKKRPKKKR